jgi:hypothetical protein
MVLMDGKESGSHFQWGTVIASSHLVYPIRLGEATLNERMSYVCLGLSMFVQEKARPVNITGLH